MPSMEIGFIKETIIHNGELCNYFLHRFNQSIEPCIEQPLQLSERAAIYQEITIALNTLNHTLGALKNNLENLPG